MPSTQEFRRRIKSVKNTQQITKAMEMVASVKMQKAQKTILEARSYVQNSWNMLLTLAKLTSPDKHPLLNSRPAEKICAIVITSDRGLCGSYNSDVIKKAINYLKKDIVSNEARNSASNGILKQVQDDKMIDIITVGSKSSGYLKSIKNCELIAEFTGFGKETNFDEVMPIAKLAIDGYAQKKYDKVVAIYSHFVSSLKQAPVVKQILPIAQDHIDIPELWEPKVENETEIEFKFEPNPDIVLERILPQFVRMQVFGAVLEANASEHSARMIAMKNATDNAQNLIGDLTLTYNTIRQNSITKEIAEISAAAESMR